MSPVVMPPALHVVRSYALSIEAVTDVIAQRIHTRLPRTKVFPLVRLGATPGRTSTVRDRIQRTPFDVHVYGDPDSATPEKSAGLFADLFHAVLLDAGGYIDTERGAVILHLEEISAPYPAPDDTDGRDEPLARWLSSVAVHIRPNP